MIEHGRRQAEPHPRRSQSRTTPKRTREGTGRKVGFVLLTLFLVGICTAAIFAGIFMKYVQTNVLPVVDIRAEDYTMSLRSFVY